MDTHCHEPWNEKIVEKLRQLREVEDDKRSRFEEFNRLLDHIVRSVLMPVLLKAQKDAKHLGFECKVSEPSTQKTVVFEMGRPCQPKNPYLQLHFRWEAMPTGMVLMMGKNPSSSDRDFRTKNPEDVTREKIADYLAEAMGGVVNSEKIV